MRRTVIQLIAVGALMSLFGGFAVAQDKEPDATLKLSEGSVALGIGYSWGKGTLSYQGKAYPVKVQGLSVGEIGVNRADAAGSVYNLKKLEDFDGNYTAARGGCNDRWGRRRGRDEESERRGDRNEEHDPGCQLEVGG